MKMKRKSSNNILKLYERTLIIDLSIGDTKGGKNMLNDDDDDDNNSINRILENENAKKSSQCHKHNHFRFIRKPTFDAIAIELFKLNQRLRICETVFSLHKFSIAVS